MRIIGEIKNMLLRPEKIENFIGRVRGSEEVSKMAKELPARN